jgi:hypothetical protein
MCAARGTYQSAWRAADLFAGGAGGVAFRGRGRARRRAGGETRGTDAQDRAALADAVLYRLCRGDRPYVLDGV